MGKPSLLPLVEVVVNIASDAVGLSFPRSSFGIFSSRGFAVWGDRPPGSIQDETSKPPCKRENETLLIAKHELILNLD